MNWIKGVLIIVILGGTFFAFDKYFPKAVNHPETGKVQGEHVVQEEAPSDQTTPTSTLEQSEIDKLKAELEQLKNQPPSQPQTIIREKEIIKEVSSPQASPPPVTQQPPPSQPTQQDTKKYTDEDLNDWQFLKNLDSTLSSRINEVNNLALESYASLLSGNYENAVSKSSSCATKSETLVNTAKALPLISKISKTAEFRQSWIARFNTQYDICFYYGFGAKSILNGFSPNIVIDRINEEVESLLNEQSKLAKQIALLKDQVTIEAKSLGLE